MGIESAKIRLKDGRRIVVVAALQDVLEDQSKQRAMLEVLASVFPDQTVVLAASTSDGVHLAAKQDEVADAVRRKRSPLDWRRYSFA